MSIYDKASLVHIPSGVKSGTLYNVLPNNADGDFDFSRGSTATRVNKDGLIETVASGVPRLDYPLLDGVVQDCPTLLLEPQRSNLIQYSEDFSNNAWYKTRTTVNSNNIISPNGALNADKISETNETGLHAVSKTETVTNGVAYTFSAFIKKGSSSFIQILFGTNNINGNPYVNFNINQGIYQNNGVTSANIENYGNDWYRCSATITTATTSLTTFISSIQSISDSRASSFTGNVNNNIYVWGAMLEEGSYPTSYIPTNGEVGGVTRSADAANGAEATFNDSEGVLYANISALTDDGNFRRVGVSDNSISDRAIIGFTNVSNQIQGFVSSNGSVVSNMNYTVSDAKTNNKVCLRYKQDYHSLWINGFEVLTTPNANTPIGLSDLSFDSGANAEQFYGKTKEVMTFNEALSDTELEALTSYDSFNEMATEQLYTIE
jgi:hypothetical protein